MTIKQFWQQIKDIYPDELITVQVGVDADGYTNFKVWVGSRKFEGSFPENVVDSAKAFSLNFKSDIDIEPVIPDPFS